MPKNFIAPIPKRWSTPVVKLLEEGDSSHIDWTFTSKQDLRVIGLQTEQDAFDLCVKILKTPGTIGECVVGMRTIDQNLRCEAWAFLCPHPLGSNVPIYAKIGLHENHLSIDIFSMHIDRKGDLEKKIERYLKTKK